MQTAVIADQSGRNSVGKTNCGNEELAFLVSAIKEGSTSRRRRLQMQLAFDNRRRFLNLVCLLLPLIPKGTSQFHCDESRPVQFVPVVGFFKIHFVIFSQKHDSQYATGLPAFQPATLLSLSNTEHRKQKWFMHIKRVYFVLSKQQEHISTRSSLHFVPKDQNKLCTHDKMGNMQNSG